MGVHLLQYMMMNITAPLMADHAYDIWELEFNSKFGYMMHVGCLALNDHKHGDCLFGRIVGKVPFPT